MSTAHLEWPVNRIRQQFVEFFKSKNHTFVPSSPVVPLNDPTLLFINAGMNQYKSLFLGTSDPTTEFGRLQRAVNSQMCIRAGGKHNDLDDVGRDTYHHTFFEMLGSWSFGDYFKKDAIQWAWELLTEVFKLPKENLYVSYFEGDPANGLEPDEEARMLWAGLVPEDHIIRGNTKDNFWEMGDTGPCGPCSEIHYDRIGGRNAASLVNKDDPMVLEVWNLVFMQFERREGGILMPLPKKHVDTGMGLERLTSILQRVTSNYDTDLWLPLFAAIQRITGYPQSYEAIRDDSNNDATVAYRVVADHARCLTTALADGAMPDSVGRGFVLRRIIRRAIRYGVQFLNAKPGFFSQLVDSVSESLGSFFLHLRDPRTVHRIKAVLADEEQSFSKTWEMGLKQFNRAAEESLRRGSNIISGADVFTLHDRYGFPVDLTCLMAEKANVKVDLEGFNAEMKANQVSNGRMTASKTFLGVYQIEELRSRGTPQTKDDAKYVWKESSGNILAIFDKKRNEFIDLLTTDNDLGDEGVGVILDCTNFYAEAGGQIYDTGRLVAAEDAVFEVRKVYNVGGYVVHIGNLTKDSTCPIPSCASVQLQVDYTRRQSIAANHTTTHQLNWVLRKVLEDEKPDNFTEVQQKGSLVADDILRFDFSYNGKLSADDLAKVEALLNEKIEARPVVYHKELELAAACKINGLRHMFGEKYPDPVCVVCVGASLDTIMTDPESSDCRKYSIEFCGGTHLTNLGDAQMAVILSEDALTKGVRRMVVVTGDRAYKTMKLDQQLMEEFEALVQVPPSMVAAKALSVFNKKVGDSAASLLTKISLREKTDGAIKKLNAQLKTLAAETKEKACAEGKAMAASHDGRVTPFVVHCLEEYGAEREALQAFADGFSSFDSDPVGLFLVGSDGEKALAVISMPSDFVDRKFSAVNWAKAAIGKGGGKPQAAQSGLPAMQVPEAVKKARAEAKKMEALLRIQ